MKAQGATGPRTGSGVPTNPLNPVPAHSATRPAGEVTPPVARGQSALPPQALNGYANNTSPLAAGGAASGAAESNLLRKAQSGDRAAFGAFVLATQDRLYNLLLRIVGDHEEARELSQDAYLKALQGLPSFRGNSAPYTWLYRIAVNLAIARLRKVRRHRTFSLDSPAGPDGTGSHAEPYHQDTPATLILARERGRQVLAALGRLDSEYRAVLVMRDIEGFDYREISDVLELPPGTVKSRIFRARLALREELQRYFGPTAGTAGLTPTGQRNASNESHGEETP